jgi:hypothetical protein
MYTHEKSLLQKQSQMLPASTLLKSDDSPIPADDSPTSDNPLSSTDSSDWKKRRRPNSSPSPLQNQYLFDSSQIVDLLRGDSASMQMDIREREFELERKQKEFELSMRQKELEMQQRQEAMELQRAMIESTKAQTNMMQEFMSHLKK